MKNRAQWRAPVRVLAACAVLTTIALTSGSALTTFTNVQVNQTFPAQFDLNTLKGKIASLRATADPEIRFSAFVEATGDGDTDPGNALLSDGVDDPTAPPPNPVLLDGTSIAAPAVTVNQDKGGAPQNETAIAVDPNNAQRIVASANDYVAGTWSCFIAPGLPCSALADGYSGTYFSNDGGKTWCCNSSDPAHIGTLIPGVTHLTGGQYDAGGDPAVTFDSRGNIYYSGLGFNRNSAPNTVAVNRGTFDAAGHLSWGAPTFINATTAPSTINDKEWIVADANPSSPFRDRVYVTFTRFIFDPIKGNYVQSPIMLAFSSDGGQTFSDPQIVGAPAIYSQGSRPVVGNDGAVYVFFDGFIRHTPSRAVYVAKSTDGGQSFGSPVKVADRRGIGGIGNTLFRVNSFPAAGVGSDGTIYVAWSTNLLDSATAYSPAAFCPTTAPMVGCHSVAVFSKSSDGGETWSTPVRINPSLDAQNRTPDGYGPGTPIAPNTRRVDTFWPAVATTLSGRVYICYYAADVISPWQLANGVFVNNARLNYFATRVDTGDSRKVTTHPVNSRYMFGGTFIGDYTGAVAGSDGVLHTLWTDTNNVQNISWFFGTLFNPPLKNRHQQDIATSADSF